MCFQEVKLILKICQESKNPHLEKLKTYTDLKEFYEKYTGEKEDEETEKTGNAMIEAFAKYEEETYKALYAEDSSLCIENIKKYFDNTDTNIWNTYTDHSFFTDNPGVMEDDDCDVKFSDYDWEKIIEIAKTDKYDINLHHYESYATIFLNFNKDGFDIQNAFLDGNGPAHLCEDLEEALK